MDNKFERNIEIEAVNIGNEIGMLDINTGHYYVLDDISTVIWELLEMPLTLNEIVTKLVEKFDISYEECMADVKVLFDEFVDNNIIMRI